MTHPHSGSGSAPKLERIAMRTSSFWLSATTGAPFVSEWQIDRNGEGTFRSIEPRRDERNLLHQEDVTRRFSAGRSGFEKIQALLRSAEPYVGGDIPCESVSYTDSAFGTVSWTRGAATRELRFNQGCPSKFAREIFRRMDEAEALASKWGEKGQIIRSEPLRDPAIAN